jgi:hypothetical protein
VGVESREDETWRNELSEVAVELPAGGEAYTVLLCGVKSLSYYFLISFFTSSNICFASDSE